MVQQQTIDILNFYHDKYNRVNFIEDDPISIPHLFSKKQDIEIAGLFAATLSWGLRKTILKNCNQLMHLMDNHPYDFIQHHSPKDLKALNTFVHRTFNSTDLLYFIAFLKEYYTKEISLEQLFLGADVEAGLINFHNTFCSSQDFPQRTKKHVATPQRKSTCKRLNMYLRWMVRKDKNGVDFGLWKTIKPRDLLCPLDVHVENYARKLKLIERPQRDWLTVVELTSNLKEIDAKDPIRFDFALFGMGIEKVIL